MVVKRKTVAKKKAPTKKKATAGGGLTAYRKHLKKATTVVDKQLLALEKKVKALKKVKAQKVKVAKKTYKSNK